MSKFRRLATVCVVLLLATSGCDIVETGAQHGKNGKYNLCYATSQHYRTGDFQFRSGTYEYLGPSDHAGCYYGVAARLRFADADGVLHYGTWRWHYPDWPDLGFVMAHESTNRSPTSYHALCVLETSCGYGED